MATEDNWEDGGSSEHQDPPAAGAIWYVADEETQLGPMSAAEVEERCHAGELGAGSMVWSLGMSDWLPLADVPQLSHLAVDAPADPSTTKLTDDESWTPISAEELAALAAAVPTPAVQHASSREARPAGFGEPAPGWSVPLAPPPSPTRKSRVPLAYAAGLGGAAIIGAIIALAFLNQVAPPASGVSKESEGMRPHSDVLARGSGGHALDPPPVVVETAGEVEESVKVEAEVEPLDPKEEKRRLCESVNCLGHGRCVARTGRCACDTGYRNAGPTRCVLKPKEKEVVLDKAAIKRIVTERKLELRPCLGRAKKPVGVAAGKYSLVVSWMIRSDGSVGQVRWGRPGWARETSLPECFAGVIQSWKFPAPGRDFAVNNYPLGNVNLK